MSADNKQQQNPDDASFLFPVTIEQFVKKHQPPKNEVYGRTVGCNSLMQKYHLILKHKKQLAEDCLKISNRISLIKKHEQGITKKKLLEEKKKEYLHKYKFLNNSDTLDGFQTKGLRMSGSKKEHSDHEVIRLESEHLSHEEMMMARSQIFRMRAEQLRRQKEFNQKFIEERRQLELNRKLETANKVRREKAEAKENLKKTVVAKQQVVAQELSSKILQVIKQCRKIEEQKEVQKVEEKMLETLAKAHQQIFDSAKSDKRRESYTGTPQKMRSNRHYPSQSHKQIKTIESMHQKAPSMISFNSSSKGERPSKSIQKIAHPTLIQDLMKSTNNSSNSGGSQPHLYFKKLMI